MVTNSQMDDLDKENKKLEEEIDKQITENLNMDENALKDEENPSASSANSENAGETASETGENPGSNRNGEDNNHRNESQGNQNENPEPQPRRPERTPDGISRAYDEMPLDGFDTKAPQDKKEKNVISKGSIVPPKRDRGGTKGKSGGDNIMEVFWNDCIMAFYAWGIDSIVDNTLDFAEWVLFAPYKSGGKVEEKNEKAKKNIYMIGDEFYKERADRFTKEKEKLAELNENLAKTKDGIAPTWVLWGKKPDFYKKLCDIQEKALADPSSPEADFMQKYGLGVDKEIVAGRFAKEEKIFTIATRLATIEEVISDAKNTISPEFSNKLDNLEKSLKNKSLDISQLKTNISTQVSELQSEIGGDDAACKEINKKLEEINKIANDGKKIAEIKKQVSEKIKEVRSASKDAIDNEEIIKAHIQKRSQQYYQKLMGNIDKIHEANKDNPETIKENIKQYLTSVNNAGKAAKLETDKIIMKNINDRSKHKQAKAAVAKISAAIDNFELNGEKISEREAATQKDEFTLTEKQFSKAIREYRFGR